MEFKTLFQILKKYLSDGLSIPDFFRDLLAMITDVSESEWGTSSDPSNKTTDSTLKTYATRKPSKKLASAIVYRLTMKNLIDQINERPDTTLTLLAKDLSVYDSTINADNVAEKIADFMTDIIQQLAGFTPASALAKQKQQYMSSTLKANNGDYLLHECGGYCPFLGCSNLLSVTNNGTIQYVYDITLIEKSGTTDIYNLLALCPHCYATYQIDTTPKTTKDLKIVKKYLSSRIQSADAVNNIQLEKGLIDVIKKIKNLKEKDLSSSILEPVEIKDKIDASKNIILYNDVKSKVMLYYVRINEIMINLDKRKIIDYEELQVQMRSLYRRLSKANKTDVEIFTEIAAKVRKATLQDDIYCQIIVAYFIQRCEVFDAITK